MKTHRFLSLVAALGALAVLPLVLAQEQKQGRGGGRGNMTAEQRIERLEQAVGTLGAGQKTKINDIYAKAAEKLQGLSPEDRREKGAEILQESGRQVRAVLTPEQQKKFDEMMAQGRGERGGGGGRGKKN